jgi:hypothetical protein
VWLLELSESFKRQESSTQHSPRCKHCRLGAALYQSLECISRVLQELMLLDMRREEKHKGSFSSYARLYAEAEMFLERYQMSSI